MSTEVMPLSFREPRLLGRTGLSVSAVTVGTGRWRRHELGAGPSLDDAVAVIDAVARDETVTVIDTSNNYGRGQSERWVRHACEAVGLTGQVLIQTKADRDYASGEFSASRMRKSVDESLERLGVDRLPLLFLHDPEYSTVAELSKPGGAIDTLLELRDEGIIRSLGVAGGQLDVMLDLVRTGLFEVLITHNRYTLVDRSADQLIGEAHRRGMGVYNAAPYGGGALATWPRRTDRYCYRQASPELLQAVDNIGGLTERVGIPIVAAALQWSVRDPRIDSTIVGMESRADYERTIELLEVAIPEDIWRQLDGMSAIR
ncbi:aldo/keto reductase [Occultella aeris]|uniref:D-threo-aldose 1-dehydrogenase n=1 Tax=Occultella aeris TaxID=2761496 RepID=A0A7M4DGF3_9MICO|nr:aldo/keto reductase [Occultella aeris]VZO35996.1 D-threo-aldose 1-dehydrogenase [Occultella aeris]